MTLLSTLIPASQTAVAGILALVGLLLWSAGIKAARAVSAAVMGTYLAVVGWAVLPNLTGVAPEICGVIGLIAGLVIGAMSLRFLQGSLLALGVGIVAAAGFYHWQGSHWSAHAATTGPAATNVAMAQLHLADWPIQFQLLAALIQKHAAAWLAIPGGLRQSMLAVGGGVAILVLLLSLQVPKYTTWVVSAAAGTALVVVGGLMLVQLRVPRYGALVPQGWQVRAGMMGAFMVLGMLLQWKFFWPRKAGEQRAKDRSGETVPAV